MRWAVPLLVLGLAHPVMAQDDPSCKGIFENVVFCGARLGWTAFEPQPVPGMMSFHNQEFTFAIRHQSDHGRTVTPGLYDTAITDFMRDLDRRTEMPDGTHAPISEAYTEWNGIEGRRYIVPTEQGEMLTFMAFDLYFDARNGWYFQTAHVGDITLQRLADSHALAIDEVFYVQD